MKHFCAEGHTINVTDIIENRTYLANIMNVAQEKYFYELDTDKGKVSLEKQYAGLEDKAAFLREHRHIYWGTATCELPAIHVLYVE